MSSELKEALSEIIDLIGKWRNDGVMEQWQYQQLFDIADNAISKQLRNCASCYEALQEHKELPDRRLT